MSTASEYRKRALDCIELSKRMSPESTPMLLSIAEAWTALAEQAERQESREDLMERKSNAPSIFRIQ
jgi:hypothetical protein